MLTSLYRTAYADLHCHLGHRASVPPRTSALAVTESPEEYLAAMNRWAGNPYVIVALGLHPLRPESHLPAVRRRFQATAQQAAAIGEVGLDFSVGSRTPHDAQVATLRGVLAASGDRLISFHSRGAEEALLNEIEEAGRTFRGVLHWFNGSTRLVSRAAALGLYFSINPAMLSSARGMRVISALPRSRVLLESDAPFARVDGRAATPADVGRVVHALGLDWNCGPEGAAKRIRENLQRLLSSDLGSQLGMGF